MKRRFAILALSAILCILALAGCGNSSSDDGNYAGTWVRDTWTNQETGAVIDITLNLYDDGTYKEEVADSINGMLVETGEWEVEKNEILLYPKNLVEGKDPGTFDSNGELIGKTTYRIQITNKTTLNTGTSDIEYHKQH
ncbi:MAG: hypothetical protein KBI01_06030 [Oscillospiraceae bacterium]|nr:hypothetical protein [Oscillospiraceae bacterium]